MNKQSILDISPSMFIELYNTHGIKPGPFNDRVNEHDGNYCCALGILGAGQLSAFEMRNSFTNNWSNLMDFACGFDYYLIYGQPEDIRNPTTNPYSLHSYEVAKACRAYLSTNLGE